jgi:hypothetical protein
MFSFIYNKKKKKKTVADNCHVSNEFRAGEKEIYSLIKKKGKRRKRHCSF